jgi:hypothetical protein
MDGSMLAALRIERFLDAEVDFDIGLLEATATIEPGFSTQLSGAFRDKYSERIGELGLTLAQFARTYSHPGDPRLTPDGGGAYSRPVVARRTSGCTGLSSSRHLAV